MPTPLDSTPIFPPGTPAVGGEAAIDANGRLGFYNATLGRVVYVVDELEANSFSFGGALATAIGANKWYIEAACAWESGRLSVGTAPTGAAIICDINKNGVTVFTTQANRPTIAISGTNQVSNTPDITTFAAGDYVTVDIDQVGSTVPGADLLYALRLRRS